MLEQARRRLAELPEAFAGRIELVAGDMTTLDLGRTFDAVICPYFTLAHLPLGEPWARSFATAARHSQPGGAAAFLPLWELMARDIPPNHGRPAMQLPLHDAGRLEIFLVEREVRLSEGCLDQVLEYVERDPGGSVLRRSRERLRYFMADPRPPPPRRPPDSSSPGRPSVWAGRETSGCSAGPERLQLLHPFRFGIVRRPRP